MYSFETKLRVRYGETDQMGYVYYGVYAQYYEVGRVELLRSLGISYKELAADLKENDKLLIDDGRIVLNVLSVDKHIIDCKVITGGELTNSKGINLQGGGLSADALTNKDIEDIIKAILKVEKCFCKN